MTKDELKGVAPETTDQKPKRGRPVKESDQNTATKKAPEEEMAKSMMLLQAENSELKRRLNQAHEQLMAYAQSDFYQRLEWLWRIITLAGAGDEFGNEFYDRVVAEFKELVFPTEKQQRTE